MSLLSGVANLFHLNLDAAKKESIRAEINLVEAVEAHIHWKLRLRSYLDGSSSENLDPMVICRDDQCKLGQWIHGPGLRHFHDQDSFHSLRADPAQFHYVAANVVKHAQAKDRAAADEIFNGEYPHISHKVVISLTELNRLVAE